MQKSIWNATSEVLKYNSIRPDHPAKIVESVVKFLKQKYKGEMKLAVDVGCGTGMSTRNLFGKFQSVLGVDLSEAMVEEARNCWKDHKNAQFQVARAEEIPVEDNSTQLVLVGRAIHYFDQQTFFKEADRMLVDNGVVAYYSVHFPTVSVAGSEAKSELINSIFWDYLDNRLQPFWPTNQFDGVRIGSRNRRDYYVSGIKSPYQEMEVDETISYDREVSVAELARELDTYGGAVRQRQEKGDTVADQMVEEFISRVMTALDLPAGESQETKIITRNSFFLVMRRKN